MISKKKARASRIEKQIARYYHDLIDSAIKSASVNKQKHKNGAAGLSTPIYLYGSY